MALRNASKASRIMDNLKAVQEALVKILGNCHEFKRFEQSDEMDSLDKEILGKLDPSGVKSYADDVSLRRIQAVGQCYRLTCKMLGKDRDTFVDNYWIHNPSSYHNPIHELASFPIFLRAANAQRTYPYLIDLAEYEWLRKRVLLIATEIVRCDSIDLSLASNRKTQQPVLNPTLAIQHFNYPVHKIASRVAAGRWKKYSYEAQDFYLVAFQNLRQRDELRIIELGEFSFVLLRYAIETKCSYESMLQYAIGLAPEQSVEDTTADVIELLIQFDELDIILGSRKISTSDDPSILSLG